MDEGEPKRVRMKLLATSRVEKRGKIGRVFSLSREGESHDEKGRGKEKKGRYGSSLPPTSPLAVSQRGNNSVRLEK
jgi:hypothetical protein